MDDDEQEAIRRSVRGYVDSLGSIRLARRYVDGDHGSLDLVWRGLSQLGIGALLVPEEHGGLGRNVSSVVPVMSELGRSLVPGPFAETYVFATLLAAAVPALASSWLPRVLEGSVRASVCSPGRADGAARLAPDARGALVSARDLVAWHAEEADVFIVPVAVGDRPGVEPTRAALVDRAAPGVTIVPERALDETRSVGHVALRDVLVARESVIGPDEYDRAADAFRLALVSGMVGGMDRLVELASEYAKNRHQFGHPIGRFQAVKHRIVDMLVMAELSRALADDAAVAIETGRPDAALAVASAKAYASRAFVSVAASNLQIHGGIGFTWESDCHLYLKRAKTLEHYGGTPSECLERVAAGLGW